MLKRPAPSRPAYAVIGKTRTLIWDHGLNSFEKPTAIYDPGSRPRFRSVSGPRSTSNYDMKESASGSNAKYRIIPSWLKPSLDPNYCELIYQKLQRFDQIYLVGGGLGNWSGINNFIKYVELRHEEFPGRIIPVIHFRLTDYSERKLMKIFHHMEESHS